MKKFFVSVVLFLLVISAVAQNDVYTNGSYITNKGDTVKGLIAASPNGSSLKFKSVADGMKISEISLDEVQHIRMENSSYTTWYGKRNVTWLDLIEHEVKNVDSFRTERILLKLQYEGAKYSLYSYKDETERFFIGYNGKIEELLMNYAVLSAKTYRDSHLLFDHPKYTLYFIFRDQMVSILGGQVSNKQKNLLDNTDYNLQHLKRMIKRLDN